jgi:polyhydroxyalkanoate synthesis repressor PhaR
MPVIKRYPNRKLYDTEAKRYVTLEGIAALIREVKEIQVVDHATGEDLTGLTLTQVIFELEKKRSGFLPQGVLAGLIRSGGDTLGSLRRSLASPLDLARHVDEEIERRMQAMVHRGELAAEDAMHLRDQLLARRRRPSAPLPGDDQIERALASRGVPTREEFLQILDQLDRLADKLDGVGQAEKEVRPDR